MKKDRKNEKAAAPEKGPEKVADATKSETEKAELKQNQDSEAIKEQSTAVAETKSEKAPAADEKLKKKKKARKKALKAWRNFFIKLGAIALIGYLLMSFVFSFSIVKDISMQPRLSQGDLTLLYRINMDDVKVDEVVAFTVDGQTYFGRVKGKPGDVIDITDSGSLYINNAIISETEIFSRTYKEGAQIEFPYTVPEGSYFILGDNREHCFDSRICGAVKFEDINGKLIGLLRRRGF